MKNYNEAQPQTMFEKDYYAAKDKDTFIVRAYISSIWQLLKALFGQMDLSLKAMIIGLSIILLWTGNLFIIGLQLMVFIHQFQLSRNDAATLSLWAAIRNELDPFSLALRKEGKSPERLTRKN